MNKPGIAAALLSRRVPGAARARHRRSSFGQNVDADAGRRTSRASPSPARRSSSAKPNLVEIDLEVSASSELTADAIVKYRDAKKRIHDAFAALKLDNVAVEERGLLVDQKGQMQNPYFFDDQPNTRTKTEVQLTRKLVVKAPTSARWTKRPCCSSSASCSTSPRTPAARSAPQNNLNPYYYYRYGSRTTTGLVRFVLEDFDKLQEEAYEKAIADARARAERLARLEQGRARADRRGPRGRRARRPDRRLGRRDRRANGWKSAEVPGDPGPRRAAGAVRGSLASPTTRSGVNSS